MPSKIVVDKEKSARALYFIGTTNAESIAKTVAERLSGGVAMRDSIQNMISSACERLDISCRAMVQADDEYIREQGDDDEPRTKRDETAKRLYSTLVELRELARGVFGLDALKGLGFSVATPQDPNQLVRFAKEITNTISQKSKSGTLPTPRKGAALDLTSIGPEIEADAITLGELLDKVALEQRELQIALNKKNETLDAYVLLFQQTANLLEGLFRFIGQDDLAARVRPATRAPGKLEVEPTEVASTSSATE